MMEIRWHGRGGQGAFTAARLLGLAASVMGGKYALAFPSFGPERRGAPVLGFTKIDDKPIRNRGQIKHCDFVIVLDSSLINDSIFEGLKPKGIVFVNTVNILKDNMNKDCTIVTFDADSLALETLKRPIVNVAMFAALIAKTDMLTVDNCLKAIDVEFKPNLREQNKMLFKRTYQMIKEGISHEQATCN